MNQLELDWSMAPIAGVAWTPRAVSIPRRWATPPGFRPCDFAGVWRGKLRCPLKHDLRDWLHRLDAHWEMCGWALAESLGHARGDTHGVWDMGDGSTALSMLKHLERHGWIVKPGRCASSCTDMDWRGRWMPGPRFDLKRFERWVAADGPQDGTGQFPVDWAEHEERKAVSA